MQSIPLVDLKAQYSYLKDEIILNISRVLDSQQFILGPEVETLERELAGYCQCQYGIGVSSGTDALLASLMAIGVTQDDEVITTAYSFFATAGAIARLGAKPVFVDICPGTLNIDPNNLDKLVTSKTKAIIPVHFAGRVADMDPIMELSRNYGIHVIEDSCQAIGAEYKGKRAGSIGNLGCFSFFPTKNLGGYGDSGFISTNDPNIYGRLRLIRNHGFHPKYYNEVIGGNFRMDAIQAAIIMTKLNYLEQWIAARKAHAVTYRSLFLKNEIVTNINCFNIKQGKIILPPESDFGRHVYHLYIIRTNKRNQLSAFLREHGIGNEVYYPLPLHLQRCFSYLGYKTGDLPISEQAANDSLALPIYPELSDEKISIVVDRIKDFLAH